jgi:N-acetylornithine carbamoyltransferase
MGIILSSYGHGIAIRHDTVPGEGQTYMREVAEWASVPVINMQCDVDHPCQTLADLMTIREEFGKDLSELKIAVSWAYAPSYVKPMSVPQGLVMLMTRYGMNVSLAHPPEYTLMDEPMRLARDVRTLPPPVENLKWSTAWKRLLPTPTSCIPRVGGRKRCLAIRNRR